ncbi:MAG: hypothetical protein AAGI23_11775 [Bacteroidota bacterium]
MSKLLPIVILSCSLWSFVLKTPAHKVDVHAFPIVTDTLVPTLDHRSQPVSHKQSKSRISLLPAVETVPTTASAMLPAASVTTTRSVAICKGEGYFSGGKPRFISGSFRDTLLTVDGRDSIIITDLSVLECKAL